MTFRHSSNDSGTAPPAGDSRDPRAGGSADTGTGERPSTGERPGAGERPPAGERPATGERPAPGDRPASAEPPGRGRGRAGAAAEPIWRRRMRRAGDGGRHMLDREALPARAARQITWQTVQRAKRARRHLIVSIPLTIGVILAYRYRETLFGVDLPVRVAAAVLLVILGWQLARDVGRLLQPWLFRRMDSATAGTAGFLIRLAFLVIAAASALRLAGLKPETLAVGGAITAVIFGLAAQQTLGHLIAGLVLISARPFRVGDRVRLHAGGLAGQVEGHVQSLGLLYTTLSQGEDSIMVPNSVVLSAGVVPLREPAGVDLRARLRPNVKPSEIQELLQTAIRTPMRADPHIALEEFDSDEVVLRISATPEFEADGPKLADEILAAVTTVAGEVDDGGGRWLKTDEHRVVGERREHRRRSGDQPADAATRFGDQGFDGSPDG